MLDSKNKVLTSLLVSLRNTEGVDTREFEAKMLALNQRFNKIIHDATAWEQVIFLSYTVHLVLIKYYVINNILFNNKGTIRSYPWMEKFKRS